MSNTTESVVRTTTQSTGTIAVPSWVIYGVVIPILGIAAIVAIVALLRWICNKREFSVSPVVEPEQNRITNDLKHEKEQNEERDHFKNFIVSDETKKLSKKPKKAVNCLNKQDESKEATLETKPLKDKPKEVKGKPVNNEGNVEEKLDYDAVSENTFNHIKEETDPVEPKRQVPHTVIRTLRSESMNNTFKPNNNSCISSLKTKSITNEMVTSRRHKKPKESAKRRNLNLIKRKLKIQEISSQDAISETSNDSNTSTMYVSSDEESFIDTSIVQSGDEDFITDDEYSAADCPKYRKTNVDALEGDVIKENQRIDVPKSVHSQIKHIPDDVSSATGESDLRESTRTKEDKSHNESTPLNNLNNDSMGKIVQKVEETKMSVADLNLESNFKIETNQYVDANIKGTDMKLTDACSIKFDNVPRMGPIASSSFKSDECDSKWKLRNKETVPDNEISVSSNLDIQEVIENEPKMQSLANYLQFENAVVKDGRVNLNRSMSLNEGEQFKSNIESKKKRKRKYTSLRLAKKESVFDAVQTLEKEPKKGILKKSKSLYAGKILNNPNINVGVRKPGIDEQRLLKEKRIDITNENKETNETKAQEVSRNVEYEQSEEKPFYEIVSSNLQTTLDEFALDDETDLYYKKGDEKKPKMFARYSTDTMSIQSTVLTETALNYNKEIEKCDEELFDPIVPHCVDKKSSTAPCESQLELITNESIAGNNEGRHGIFHSNNVSSFDDQNVDTNTNTEQESSETCFKFDLGKCETHQEKAFENNDNSQIFEPRIEETNTEQMERKIVTSDNNETNENKDDNCNVSKRDQIHFIENDFGDIMESSYAQRLQQTENNGIYIPRHLEQIDSSLELIEIPSTSEVTTDTNDDLNEIPTFKRNAYENEIPVLSKEKEFGGEQGDLESELEDIIIRPNVENATLKVNSSEKIEADIRTDSDDRFKSPMKKDKNNFLFDKPRVIEFAQNGRPKTPHLTSDGFKMPSFPRKATKLMNKIVRHKSNPSFDKTYVEFLKPQIESKPTAKNQLSKSDGPMLLKPIAKKDASSLLKNTTPILSPKLSDNCIIQERLTKESLSMDAHFKELNARKSDKNTIMEMKTTRNNDPTYASKEEFSMESNVRPTRTNGLAPLKKERRSKFNDRKSLSEDSVSKDHVDDQDLVRSPLFHLRNYDIQVRSKTPSVEMERAHRNLHEPKRSKTPMPVPTYLIDQLKVSSDKPSTFRHPLSKLKTDYIKNPNMDTFSRNFPSVQEEKRSVAVPFRSIRRFPNRNVPVSESTKISEHKLLERRGKDSNILDERRNSKRAPIRERPKSAMSMRSAPRLTSMDNVTSLPRHSNTMNQFRTKTGGNRSSIITPAYDNQTTYGTRSNSRASDVVDVRQTNCDIDESDSELEEFFANPDVESMQFGNQNLLNNGCAGTHRAVFTTYKKKTDLTKSISLKV